MDELSCRALNRAQLLRAVTFHALQLDPPHLEAAALDGAEVRAERITAAQAFEGLLGDAAVQRDIAGELADLDLADLLLGQAGVAGEGAQQVAGAQLVLL